MLKYTIRIRDEENNTGINIDAESEANVIPNVIGRMAPQRHIEEAGAEAATRVATVTDNDEAVTAMDIAERFQRLAENEERFAGQIARAREVLAHQALNKNTMHYIMTGEKIKRRVPARR